MDGLLPYRQQHAADWAELERALGALPQRLSQQAAVIKSNLAIAYSPTGLFGDVFTHPADYPLPYLHDWLIHDWQLPLPEAASRSLFHGALYAFIAGYISEARHDGDTLITEEHLGLQQLLAQQAARQYALLFAATGCPPSSARTSTATTSPGGYSCCGTRTVSSPKTAR